MSVFFFEAEKGIRGPFWSRWLGGGYKGPGLQSHPPAFFVAGTLILSAVLLTHPNDQYPKVNGGGG